MCGVRHLERSRAIPVFFFRSIVALEAAERNLGKCKERKSRSGAAKKDRGNIAHAIVYVLSCCSLGVSFVGARCACRCFIGIWQERRGGERRRRKCSVLALFVVLGASKCSVIAYGRQRNEANGCPLPFQDDVPGDIRAICLQR